MEGTSDEHKRIYEPFLLERENRELLITTKAGDSSAEREMAEHDGSGVLTAQNQAWQGAQVGKAITLSAIKTQLHIEIRMCVTSCHQRNALHFLPQSLLEESWNRQPEPPLPSRVRMLHHISRVTLHPRYFLFQQ